MVYVKLATGWAIALFVALATGLPHAAPGHEPLIAFSAQVDHLAKIHTVRPDGRGLRIRSRFTRRNRIYGEWSPAWSPDGRSLAFVRNRSCSSTLYDECYEIWTRPLSETAARQLTHIRRTNDADRDPAWSPDGRWVAFVRERDYREGPHGGVVASIHVVPSSGGSVRPLTNDPTYDESPVWRPDGGAILFVRNPPNEFGLEEQNARLVLISPDGSHLRSFPGELRGRTPAWSPDGRRIAFTSYRNRNGQQCGRDWCRYMGELYIVRADGTGLRRMTWNKLDDRDPTWSPDGRWIAFASGRTEGTSVRYRIYRIRSTGGRPQLVAQLPRAAREPAWRPR